jgi:hypothetical protein
MAFQGLCLRSQQLSDQSLELSRRLGILPVKAPQPVDA